MTPHSTSPMIAAHSLPPREAMPITDPTAHFLATVRAWAIRQGAPAFAKFQVCVKIADTGEKIGTLTSFPSALPVDNAAERNGTPALSSKQKRILASLLDGPMKGDALAEACGLANRSSLHSGRGVRQLTEWGMVENSEEHGYTLTAFGEDVAVEVAEG
jgi:hypothetical protein